MRIIKNILIIAIVLALLFWIAGKIKIVPSITEWLQPKEVIIDKTPILVKEIKSIGELITYSAFDEVVADSIITTRGSRFVNSINSLAPIPILPTADKQLVLIGRGKVLAGVDLTQLTTSAINVSNDTIRINLPAAKIIDAVLNPGDFETFVERGRWTPKEVTLVKLQAKEKMILRALNRGILPKADEKAREVITTFLNNMGYKWIYVE